MYRMNHIIKRVSVYLNSLSKKFKGVKEIDFFNFHTFIYQSWYSLLSPADPSFCLVLFHSA